MGPAVPRTPSAKAGDDQQGEEDAVERVGGERTVPLDLVDQAGRDDGRKERCSDPYPDPADLFPVEAPPSHPDPLQQRRAGDHRERDGA